MRLRNPLGRGRKASLLLVCIAIGGAVAVGGNWLAPRPGAPMMTIDEPVIAFGDVRPGAVLRHTFTIRNDGQSDLRIGSIKTTCGCTEAEVSRPVIGRSQSAVARVAFHAPEKPGTSKQVVSLATNDPSHPFLQVAIEARVVVPIEVRPGQIDFGVIARSDLPAERSAEVLLGPEFALAVNGLSVESSSEYLRVTLSDPTAPGMVPSLIATLRPDTPAGPITASARVFLPGDDRFDTRVPILGQVRGRAIATPSTLILEARMGASTPLPAKAEVRGRAHPYSLASWNLSPELQPILDVRASDADGRARFEVGLRPAALAVTGPKGASPRGYLRVALRDAAVSADENAGIEAETIDIPILVFVRPERQAIR